MLLQQPWGLVEPLALRALEAFRMRGAVQGHVCTVGVFGNKMSWAVWACQRASWSMLTTHVQRKLEPESESPIAQCAREGVAACVGCPVLLELQRTVGGERTVGAAHMPHTCHSFQFLGRQLLLVHHGHVSLLLAFIWELVAAQPARKLEVASVN